MAARALPILLGGWLAASAFLLSGAGEPSRTADLAAGAALVLVAALARPGSPAGFSVVVLACWLVAAPAALSFPRAANAVNDVAVGLVALAAALHARALARAERWVVTRARAAVSAARRRAGAARAPGAAARA
ncbi:MAG TPA: hypothetical protein VD838_06025 [Anaeromyxobacteraceae bacterium]|nr:hypothetical protein [Anaeromyxobacteraceae bacterium]